MIINEDELMHYGIKRRSGRYPWGSGGNAQNSKTWLDYIRDLRERLGWSDTQVAESMGMSTTELRDLRTIARNEHKLSQIHMAKKLHEKGYSNQAIADRMGLSGESTVRNLLKDHVLEKEMVLANTAEMLKRRVAEDTYIDIGTGAENGLGISDVKLRTAVAMLRNEGYEVHTVPVQQQGTTKDTNVKVLAPPGTTWGDVARNKNQITQIQGEFTDDGGRTWFGIKPPMPVDPARVEINWGGEGGEQADGVLYIRPGVDDISIGDNLYAQVRVKVGDGHYIKGMAVYNNDLPDGVDILFNTNKTREELGGDKLAALKPLETDPDNPFGTYIRRQIVDKEDNLTSAMNLVNEEGGWADWRDSVASQVLSKQSPVLAKEQLDVTLERRQNELNEIMALTNPIVRQKLLREFSEGADSAAVQLDAAGFKRQGWHAILPVNSLPDNQVYAPNFRDGERVVLIRYPHAGKFEIPELTVNNSHPESKRLFGGARDAIGINHRVAQQLSGADFDGDTVLVIPNNQRKIRTEKPLGGLVEFEPRAVYKRPEGVPKIKERTMQIQMGEVSNLITDMTIRGAPHSDIERAVKHSMVMIDAYKHDLDYRRSAQDFGIQQLKERYQIPYRDSKKGGASTLISRSTSEKRVAERRERRASEGGPIDPVTGRKVYTPTNRTYVNKKGETVKRTTKSTQLAEVDDAFKLSSGHPVERVYAEYSNATKALANKARKEMLRTSVPKRSPSAAKAYAKEVDRLNAALRIAESNAPLERAAQIMAGAIVESKKAADPSMDAAKLKKIKGQALVEARTRTGARKQRIEISDSEWEAIQAGAISPTKLRKILDNADPDRVRELATPKTPRLMSPSRIARAKRMLANGYTRAEVAQQLGVSITTLDTGVKGE